MITIQIDSNDAGQRLDRFLKKYLKRASLSGIYKIIRKDLRLNGKRAKEDDVLAEGDELQLYISEERLQEMTRPARNRKAKRQFRIAYEDEQVLIVEKPWGLLTHGDSTEKKNTLQNQVCTYLQEKGEYHPGREKTFTPSPVNRLDRNTTGLVIFGKTAEGLRQLTRLIREREKISKYYLTVVAGDFAEEMLIEEALVKDPQTNTVTIEQTGQQAKSMIRPMERTGGSRSADVYSLVEVELITGRTHQIRAHLAGKGYPLAGDSKYGTSVKGRKANERLRKYGVTTQLLHAYRLSFGNLAEDPEHYSVLTSLSNKEIRAEMPADFARVWKELKG